MSALLTYILKRYEVYFPPSPDSLDSLPCWEASLGWNAIGSRGYQTFTWWKTLRRSPLRLYSRGLSRSHRNSRTERAGL